MVTATDRFAQCFAQLPLVAILRGVRPDEVEPIGDALVEAGFTLIEVPLNSPDPFDSIARLVRRIGERAMVGAGTVLATNDVARLQAIGAGMVISPNADPAVIRASRAAGLVSMPGFATPSEAFAALAAGATALKVFPAEMASPAVLRAMRAVLPPSVPVLPVGGITDRAMAEWVQAGASGFGLGSALYRKGDDPATVAGAAAAFVRAWRNVAPDRA